MPRAMTVIALVGMPGSGKSSVGRQLARRLNWAFADADAEIEQQVGCTIREYFERHGEPAFREVEQAALAGLLNRQRLVLATGGGAAVREANRRALAAQSEV